MEGIKVKNKKELKAALINLNNKNTDDRKVTMQDISGLVKTYRLRKHIDYTSDFIISIKLVSLGDLVSWERTKDCEFTCNYCVNDNEGACEEGCECDCECDYYTKYFSDTFTTESIEELDEHLKRYGIDLYNIIDKKIPMIETEGLYIFEGFTVFSKNEYGDDSAIKAFLSLVNCTGMTNSTYCTNSKELEYCNYCNNCSDLLNFVEGGESEHQCGFGCPNESFLRTNKYYTDVWGKMIDALLYGKKHTRGSI